MREKKVRTCSKLTKVELRVLYSLHDKIEIWREHFERHDVVLNYGNGSVSEQLACASCCFEMILQEVSDLPF